MVSKVIVLCVLLIISTNHLKAKCSAGSENNTLVLVHTLFRHEERTPDSSHLYPNDPYINNTYEPYGKGELINKGKVKNYRIGQYLRKRYDDFLGKTYTPDILEAWSSSPNRTKMGMELVLAGLFPPVGEQIWMKDLNWQPIPFNSLENNNNQLFFGVHCTKFFTLFLEYIKTPNVRKVISQYDWVVKYAAKHSGLKTLNFGTIQLLYYGLLAETEFNLTLPKWTNKIFPQPLKKIAILDDALFVGTKKLTQISIGKFFEKITIDTNAKIEGKLIPEGRKIFLYSGHDTNIANFLNALLDFYEHPPYGAFILIEIHKMDNVYGAKLFYQNYSQEEPKLLKIRGCEEFCSWEMFKELTKDYLPPPSKNICGNVQI